MRFLRNILPAIALAAACSGPGAPEAWEVPGTVQMEQVLANRDLLARLHRNFDRMETEHYQPGNVFLTEEESGGWSGDTEGRTILALIMDARSTGRQPRYLDSILDRLPKKLNERGYLGPDFFPNVSEQQLGGNCWLLNALSEHYLWKGDSTSLALLRSVAEGLYVPAKEYFARYPIDPSLRDTGGAAGTILATHDGWMLSSDVGAGLACLHGMVQAYDVLRLPALKESIDACVEAFRSIDPVEIKAHTHPYTLIMLGLLRYSDIIGDPSLVEWTERLWDICLEAGMSENFGCYNWLGRFNTWTEPCAITDAFIVATELWRHTGRVRYRDVAEQIWFNALSYSQFNNGGFGLQNCPGDASGTSFLRPVNDEAWWCCTMRGAEGLARVSQYTWFTRGDDLFIGTLRPSAFKTGTPEGGELTIDIDTEYPVSGTAVIRLSGDSSRKVRLHIPAPKWTSGHALRVNGKRVRTTRGDGFLVTGELSAGDVLEYSFRLKTWYDGPQTVSNNPEGTFRVFHGPVLLCSDEDISFPRGSRIVPAGDGGFQVKGTDISLHTLSNFLNPGFSVARASTCQRKIIFR
ncbi:MAG: glycoside hydrolase family 127 protein [Bacteroidales bacterium]|nr:glycoside hydrolase family 127 protein [Bacteroidales bacterium]